MARSLPAFSRVVSIPALAGMIVLGACGGGAGSLINYIPIPGSTSTPVSAADCPTNGSSPSALVAGVSPESARRVVSTSDGTARYVPDQLAVYSSADPHTFRIVHVDPSKIDSEISRLRALSGVRDVARVTFQHRLSIAVNDPYYAGFTGTSAPCYETSSIPGQWDMHAIDLDGAWSQFTSAPVIAAPIAIIDTGVDLTHPELMTPSGVPAPKVIRAYCYVTYPTSAAQSSGPYVTDTDGHGTNVAGIADGDTDNTFAFAGLAFDAPLLAYRIFPSDPPAGCLNSTDPQCNADSADIASAIDDAVAHGAKVINLSLGAPPPCLTNDPEYVSVENAISRGVVVVAASGNDGSGTLDCPAADPGVIAVGASALNDSNPLAITEYVAGYSNWSTSGAQAGGGAYLVAPGGDACPGSSSSSCSDADDLHWIEHIYSSTAVQTGDCGSDFASESGNCRILIVGTSMAAPHVAGVVSLMLAKNPKLTPAQVASGLCASADSINDSKQGCGRVNAAAAVSWAAAH